MFFSSSEREQCFSTPRRLTDVTPWHIHIPFAFYLIQRLRPSLLVELGVHKGDSYCAFCQAVDELSLSCVCYGVDTWEGDDHAGYYGERVIDDLHAYHDPLYGRFSKLLRMTFDEALSYFSKKTIDLLHIDGAHLYSQVSHDFESWLPKMSNRGVIVLHDISVRERDFGVWKLWEALQSIYPSFSLPHQHGIGVVCVGDIPTSLSHVLSATQVEKENISIFFHSLGEKMLSTSRELQEQNTQLHVKEEQICEKSILLAEREVEIAEYKSSFIAYEKIFQDKESRIAKQRLLLEAIQRTILWRVARSIYAAFDMYIPAASKPRSVLVWILGLRRSVFRTQPQKQQITIDDERDIVCAQLTSDSDKWIYRNRLTEKSRQFIASAASQLEVQPLFTFVVPVYNTPLSYLKGTLDSIAAQLYPHWEAIIINDASTDYHVGELVSLYTERDVRFVPRSLPANGGSARACNEGLKCAKGEFIVFVDHDDLITSDALLQVAQFLQTHREADVLYTDNDRISSVGKHHSISFKPGWSPDLLTSFCYVSHLKIFSKRIITAIGFLEPDLDGAQDYDYLLRATEHTSQIFHIPLVLAHWREVGGQQSTSQKSIDAGRRAIQNALKRRSIGWATAAQSDIGKKIGNGIYRLQQTAIFPETVSIIITIRNRWDLLKKCVDSIREKSTHHNYELIIADDDSDNKDLIAYLKSIEHVYRILWFKRKPDEGFNYSKLCNRAAEHATGEYLLFLNADIEVLTDDWIEQLLIYAKMPNVGIVGARLRFPDLTIQHAGIVKGFQNGLADHTCKGLPIEDHGYMFSNVVARNVSAVTGACFMVRKDLFDSLGRFDAVKLPVAFNDVDFCLRAGQRGYRSVFTPECLLLHLESVIKGRRYSGKEPISDLMYFRKKWSNYRDSFYNTNLSLDRDAQFEIETQNNSRLQLFDLTAKKLVICSMSHNLLYGGAQRSKFFIDRYLHDHGADIHVFAAHGGPALQWYQECGIPVTVMDFVWSNGHEVFSELVDASASYIRKLQPDVVYANTLEAAYGIEAAYREKVPSVWNIRESADYREFFKHVDCGTREAVDATIVKANRLIFPCHATAKLFRSYDYFGTSTVIHNGIDPADFGHLLSRSRSDIRAELKLPLSKKIISIVGITCERKGQLDFVHAAIEVLKRRDDVYFLIVGGRSSMSGYLDKINSACAGNTNISVITETSRSLDYLCASDIFVCASYEEAFPRVILEAMVCSVPIITTPVFGIIEQIIHGKTGLFFQPGHVMHLVHSMNLLLDNPQYADKLAVQAREYVEQFFPQDPLLNEYLKIFQAVSFEDVNDPIG